MLEECLVSTCMLGAAAWIINPMVSVASGTSHKPPHKPHIPVGLKMGSRLKDSVDQIGSENRMGPLAHARAKARQLGNGSSLGPESWKIVASTWLAWVRGKIKEGKNGESWRRRAQ